MIFRMKYNYQLNQWEIYRWDYVIECHKTALEARSAMQRLTREYIPGMN